MPDQQDPAVEAYEEIRKCIHSTEPSVTGMELDITEIIRKAYAPLLAAKDKRIAELVAVLDVVRAEFCDSCDYQPCYDDCDGYVKLDKLLAEDGRGVI